MLRGAWTLLLCWSLCPGAARADELVFRSLRELWANAELVLTPSRMRFTDAAGTTWGITSDERCTLIDETHRKPAGSLGAPSDWGCDYLGGSPAGDFWFLARDARGEFCTWRFDDVKRALEEGRPPRRSSCEVPVDANPPGGAPTVVGWFDDTHVVLKTAYCCGSFKYSLLDITTAKSVLLGMSFDDGRPGAKYPTFRPWSAQRPDYWLVQRTQADGRETAVGLVHCSKVVEYAFKGSGALEEAKPRKGKMTLHLPDEPAPCGPSQQP